MLRIIQTPTQEHYRHVRNLFQRYADSLDFDLDFQIFSLELCNGSESYPAATLTSS